VQALLDMIMYWGTYPSVLFTSNPDKFNWVFSNLCTLNGYKPGQIYYFNN